MKRRHRFFYLVVDKSLYSILYYKKEKVAIDTAKRKQKSNENLKKHRLKRQLIL